MRPAVIVQDVSYGAQGLTASYIILFTCENKPQTHMFKDKY